MVHQQKLPERQRRKPVVAQHLHTRPGAVIGEKSGRIWGVRMRLLRSATSVCLLRVRVCGGGQDGKQRYLLTIS